MRSDHIDIVETVGQGDAMFWGRVAARFAGARVVISTIHSTYDAAGKAVVCRMNRVLTPITDAYLTVANKQKEHLVSAEGIPNRKSVVIYNGVDHTLFDPQKFDSHTVRARLGLDDGDRVFGIVAALRPEKAHTVLLDATRLVVDKLPEAKLVIVGDGPERANIERHISSLGISRSVLMTGARSDIPPLLSAFDVAVLCSYTEAFPISVLEYMAAGKPVVATRVGGMEEVTQEGETAFLVPPGAAPELADSILQLLTDDEAARRMGRAGRARAMDQFGIDKMMKARERLYQDLLSRRGRSID
jgi:glycosyltransferase involved in cell wall biosynthesis